MPGDRCPCLSRRADRHRDVAGSRTGRASRRQHPVFLCRGAVACGSHGTWEDDGAPLVVRRRQNGSICAQVPCWGGPGASRKFESNLEGEAKGVYNATFYATITMLVCSPTLGSNAGCAGARGVSSPASSKPCARTPGGCRRSQRRWRRSSRARSRSGRRAHLRRCHLL